MTFRRAFGLITMLLVLALFLFFLPSCSSGPCYVNYWVSTEGSDSGSGDEGDPFLTLERAREAVRGNRSKGTCTVNVNISGGTYRLGAPLTLAPEDSGAEGAEVVYRAVPGEAVVISGAELVDGWTLHDPALGIWRAEVSTDTLPRQLYVNGLRATRARSPDYPNYYYPTDAGYLYEYIIGLDPQIPPTWQNPTAVEAVTVTQWKMMRCPVAEVLAGREVIMQDYCWKNVSVFPAPWSFYLLSWWENAYELLDEAGEWYLEPGTRTLYYMPREGEDMTTAEVELPVLEALVVGSGDASRPVSFIRFENLGFMHATWSGPNGPDGYALDQSGFLLVGSDHGPNAIGHDPDTVSVPGNLSFSYAQNIVFQNNSFAHMGGIALDFGTGSQGNEILGNTFSDISAAAIKVGGIAQEDHHPVVDSQITKDNLVADNLIEYAGQEYYDAPGIYIGFTTRSVVEHNEISHVPWSGIAIGWGWGLLDPGGFTGLPNATPNMWGTFDTPSAAQGNRITHNRISHFLEKLWDGGAIYTTGFQGASLEEGQLIAWNVATDKRPAAGGNTFYTDGGSRYVTLLENVSLSNPQGFVDFGPCLKASSFEELCVFTDVVPYGADMGGCVPYGDMLFEKNYLRDHLAFYDICTNDYYPNAPTGMSFVDNVKVSSAEEVPASILEAAGRR